MQPIPIDRLEFWVEKGERSIVYHEGLLALDRFTPQKTGNPTVLVPKEPLHSGALFLLQAAKEGRVHLTQKRLGRHRFQYIATRRRRSRGHYG